MKRNSSRKIWCADLLVGAVLSVGVGLGGCVVGEEDAYIGTNGERISFEEFEASTYLEPWDNGVYIVNGDTPIENVKKLREFWWELYGDGALIVHRSGGADAKWNDTQKLNLTYCISDSFGSNKNMVVEAMYEATENGWEQVANVNFVHAASEDSNCTAYNGNVVFDIRPVSNQPYLARAFFPNQSRSTRNVLVDSSAFGPYSWPLENVLLHELGHALGFRHEHTRPEAGQCYEDSSWRELTEYDSASVMHYPQCGGTGPDLTMSPLDAEGAAALYGPPSGGSDPDPDPDPVPDPDPDPDPVPDPDPSGTPQSGSASGTLALGQSHSYQPLSVVPGSDALVQITGSGDADLYVRFGTAPTQYEYDCRPYLNGSSETCDLDVPAGATSMYIMVYGYTAASYTLTAEWVAP